MRPTFKMKCVFYAGIANLLINIPLSMYLAPSNLAAALFMFGMLGTLCAAGIIQIDYEAYQQQ